MSGSPAVALRANASGHRVVVVPLPANDALAVLDADDGSVVKTIPLGVLPVAAVVNRDGSVAYVSNLGGRKPGPRDRTAKQCCDPFAELVRVDARGIAQPGNVTRIDLVTGAIRKTIPVGRHPTGIAWDERSDRLYVANGSSDAVSVIDTRRDSVVKTIAVAPFRERKVRLAATGVAVTPDGTTLFVTLGGVNAVAVYGMPAGQLRGLIPTGWYPATVDGGEDGHTLAVGALFGVGSGNGRASGMTGRFVLSYRGSVNVIAKPAAAELAAYTTSVAQNNRLTQAIETEYPMWPLYTGRSYPSEGVDPLAYSSGGFLWEAAQSKGRTVRVFGEYAPSPQWDSASVRTSLLAQYRDSQPHNPAYFRGLVAKRYNTRSDIPSLDRLLVREYPGWTQTIPDVVKADIVLEHLRVWESKHTMPNLVLIILPSDHTEGTSPGWCTPKACVADNDLALGRIVEGLSRSSFWKSMAIVAVEDDAHYGVDHIDGHRTVALVAGPYARRAIIDPTFYSQLRMVKTIELMLGLPALSLYDLVATDMRASFIGPDEAPNVEPYTALMPRQSLYEVNQQVGSITGPRAAQRRPAALASARMNFREPDAAPSELLNRILWHDARGWGAPYPEVKRSLFFPMAVDLTNAEREERMERQQKP